MMSCVHSIFIIRVYVYIPFLNVIYLFIYSFIFWKNLRGINWGIAPSKKGPSSIFQFGHGENTPGHSFERGAY